VNLFFLFVKSNQLFSSLVRYLSRVSKVSWDCYDACFGIRWRWAMLQFCFIFEKQVVESLKFTFVTNCCYVRTMIFHSGHSS
jgi:hypothetical protein